MRSVFFVSLAAGAAAESKVLAMEGGGWRAQATDAGFMSGLLAFLGKQKGKAPTFQETGLLDNFDHFSTNSGSSWFFSSLAYSQGYHDLIEGMAASPSTAAAQNNAKFTTPYLEATKVDPSKASVLQDLARDVLTKLLGKGDEDDIFLFQYFLASNCTWNEFTSVLLDSTAQIDANTKLGSDVMPFAKDKVWVAANSVLLPTNKVRLFQNDALGTHRVSYRAETKETLPTVVPAKFSITLGAGIGSSAPHEFVSSRLLSDPVDIKYTSMVVPIVDVPSATSAPLDMRDFSDGAMTEAAGTLRVDRVAAASSAAAGIAPALGSLLGDFADAGLSLLDADLTPWASSAGDGETFEVGNSLVAGLRKAGGITKSSIQALADNEVHGLIDGGYTDGTGLAAAVAAGADEVLVLLNSNATNTPFYVELLFEGGPKPLSPGSSREIMPVFNSPAASSVASDFMAFQELSLPSSTYIKKIAVGSVKATTADNKYFDIAAGRNVTINIVNFCSELGIGGDVDFTKYDNLIQEIITAFNADENAAFVSETLLPMVIGSSAMPAALVV